MIIYQKTSPQSGFSLLELLIAVVITGIILGMISTAIISFSQQITDRENKRTLETVQDEINRFLELNGRYPCPASLSADISNANFGLESQSDCRRTSNVDGVFQATGRNNQNIKIGAVPVRSLNLPDEYIFDAYNTRLYYAVTSILANSGSYDRESGAITVNDSNGNSITAPSGNAPYILLSLGRNKTGGFEGLSGIEIDDGCRDLSSLEEENCDKDDVFIRTIITSDSDAQYYDDVLMTDSGSQLGQQVPSGGIIYFDLAECPRGWQDYFGADTPPDTVACKKI